MFDVIYLHVLISTFCSVTQFAAIIPAQTLNSVTNSTFDLRHWDNCALELTKIFAHFLVYQYYFSNTGTVAGFNLVQVIMPSISSMGNELAVRYLDPYVCPAKHILIHVIHSQGNSATALLILNGCFSFALMAGSVGQTTPVCRLAGNQAGLTLQGNVNNIVSFTPLLQSIQLSLIVMNSLSSHNPSESSLPLSFLVSREL